MALFSSELINEATQTTPYLRAPMHDRTFMVWAVIALIGLALMSVAFGVAPAVDPAIFAAP